MTEQVLNVSGREFIESHFAELGQHVKMNQFVEPLMCARLHSRLNIRQPRRQVVANSLAIGGDRQPIAAVVFGLVEFFEDFSLSGAEI